MFTALPFVIFIVSYIYWVIIAYSNKSFDCLKREVYTTMIIQFFVVYPNTVKFIFSHFSCVKVHKMNSYLNGNTAIECWDSVYAKYAFSVAIPGILLWALGFPTISLILMIKNRKRLHLGHYRVIYGFFYNGYRLGKFYWELVIMHRKIILITISVFMISQPLILQAFNVVIILFS